MKGTIATGDGIDLPPLNGKELGTSFGWLDRLFYGFQEGKVFDYGDWEARDLSEMMSKDYKARQIENVLALPILSAEHSIVPVKGDKGEAERLQDYWDHDEFNGGCETTLDQIIAQMTTAFTYKRAYFEKVWNHGHDDYEGQVVYDKVAYRPATTCRLARDVKNGNFAGFQQEPYFVGPGIAKGVYPIDISAKRAFVYIYGTRRDPLNGSSDMEIPFWCYKTKQKLLFLWFQFLEGVSLPRTIVIANDAEAAAAIAKQVAGLKSSGVLPVGSPSGAESVRIQSLDVSGKGAEQFSSAIAWLDQAATNSVLAGFLDLTGAAANGLRGGGGGSYALSKDASDFFLQQEEAKAREMEFSLRRDLFAPLIRANMGKKARIPKLKFEPLNDEDKATSVSLLTAALAAPGNVGGIPPDFISALAKQVADYCGLDGDKIEAAFQQAAKDAKTAAAAQGAPPLGQEAAGMGGAVQAASDTMSANGAGPGSPQAANNPFAM